MHIRGNYVVYSHPSKDVSIEALFMSSSSHLQVLEVMDISLLMISAKKRTHMFIQVLYAFILR